MKALAIFSPFLGYSGFIGWVAYAHDPMALTAFPFAMILLGGCLDNWEGNR